MNKDNEKDAGILDFVKDYENSHMTTSVTPNDDADKEQIDELKEIDLDNIPQESWDEFNEDDVSIGDFYKGSSNKTSTEEVNNEKLDDNKDTPNAIHEEQAEELFNIFDVVEDEEELKAVHNLEEEFPVVHNLDSEEEFIKVADSTDKDEFSKLSEISVNEEQQVEDSLEEEFKVIEVEENAVEHQQDETKGSAKADFEMSREDNNQEIANILEMELNDTEEVKDKPKKDFAEDFIVIDDTTGSIEDIANKIDKEELDKEIDKAKAISKGIKEDVAPLRNYLRKSRNNLIS